MIKICREVTKPLLNGALKRHISSNVILNGEEKTTVHVMNTDLDFGLMVDAYSQVGFRLNNGFTVLGPMIIFKRSVLSWNVGNINHINEKSLSLFSVLEPKLDILVIGVGDKQDNHNYISKLLKISKQLKIVFEILPTDHACTTFNFLNSEGRNAAAALIPPKDFKSNLDEELASKLRYQNLYEGERSLFM